VKCSVSAKVDIWWHVSYCGKPTLLPWKLDLLPQEMRSCDTCHYSHRPALRHEKGASGECSREQRVCRTHFPCRPKSFTIFPRMHMSLPRWNFSRCSSKLLPATIIEDCLLAISICMYKSPPSDRFEGVCLSELYTCKRNTVISWVHVQPHFTLTYNNSVYNDSISHQSRIMP